MDDRPTWVIVLVGALGIMAACVPIYFHYLLADSIHVVHFDSRPPVDYIKLISPQTQPDTRPSATQAGREDLKPAQGWPK
jgi:hypothetical protein